MKYDLPLTLWISDTAGLTTAHSYQTFREGSSAEEWVNKIESTLDGVALRQMWISMRSPLETWIACWKWQMLIFERRRIETHANLDRKVNGEPAEHALRVRLRMNACHKIEASIFQRFKVTNWASRSYTEPYRSSLQTHAFAQLRWRKN